MTILALFEQFLGAFCSYIFDYACLGRKAYCYQKSFKLWKNCSLFIKNMFKDLPLPERITMSLTTTPTSRSGFSMMRGKFCQCFEIARTAVAQFGYFTLKTRVRFQKEGFQPSEPPLGVSLDAKQTHLV